MEEKKKKRLGHFLPTRSPWGKGKDSFPFSFFLIKERGEGPTFSERRPGKEEEETFLFLPIFVHLEKKEKRGATDYVMAQGESTPVSPPNFFLEHLAGRKTERNKKLIIIAKRDDGGEKKGKEICLASHF